MTVLTGPQTHDTVRTLEGMELRRRLDEARAEGKITGREPIVEQMRKSGLDNKNRGRIDERWKDLDPDDYIIDGGKNFDINTPK